MRFMTESAPARVDLVRVLDTVFRRILEDGERTRAEREAGAPPWTPEPQTDPRYEGLDLEEWGTVAYPSEQWIQEWRDAVVMNCQEDVRPMVTDALSVNDLTVTEDTPEWRRLCRMALIVAARAHEINARREWGDYSDGWRQSAGVPPSELPGGTGSNGRSAPLSPAALIPTPVQQEAAGQPRTVMLISESFSAFIPTQSNWSAGYHNQARQALLLFISLMSDLQVNGITGDTAETFRNRLSALPAKHGKSIYAGMSPSQATTTAERLREAMKAPGDVVQFGKQSLPRVQADMLSQHLSMKTVNKHLTMFTSWAGWMDGWRRARRAALSFIAVSLRLLESVSVRRKRRRSSGWLVAAGRHFRGTRSLRSSTPSFSLIRRICRLPTIHPCRSSRQDSGRFQSHSTLGCDLVRVRCCIQVTSVWRTESITLI